jgi:hypothetical protein
MTIKRIQVEDVLGDKYYTYELSSSDYSPSLNTNITITCTLKDPYNNIMPNVSLALYKNGSLVSNATTNLNGVATWSNISCNNSGVQVFKVGTSSIEIIVDNMTFADYEDDMSAQDSSSIFLRELDNLIQAITGRGDL